jgi:hypothetical protein
MSDGPSDPEYDYSEVLARYEQEVAPGLGPVADDLGETTSLRSFIAQGKAEGFERHEWVIPDFLEHKDKMLVTGPSGKGKSTLIRQVGMCAAAGRLPFERPGNESLFDPQRVLMLDLENRPRQTWRGMRELGERFGNQYGNEALQLMGDNLHLKVREDGLDLLNPANLDAVLTLVGNIQPDLMVIGPLYMLSYGDGNSEQVAFTVARALRKITVEFNVAVLTEAHSAKAPGNDKPRKDPMGSSIWIRWPDFGHCIFPTDDDPNLFQFAEFRGDREPARTCPGTCVRTGPQLLGRARWGRACRGTKTPRGCGL